MVVGDTLGDGVDVVGTSDEGAGFDGQIALSAAFDAQRWELGVADLEDLLGRRETLQPVLAQVGQVAVDQVMIDQRCRCGGDEDLSTVACVHHSGHPVERRSEVVVAAQLGFPGVETDPDGSVSRAGQRARRRRRLMRR